MRSLGSRDVTQPTQEATITSWAAAVTVLRAPESVSAQLEEQLAACWAETANAGGAVGFPWPPVTLDDVRGAVADLVARVDADRAILIVAHDLDGLAGWVSLDRNMAALVAHWATVRRLQTHPRSRGRGIGSRLMNELVRVARTEGLEQLHLTVRGGMGLEAFYRGLGWHVVGSWPRALRLSQDDYRDEVLMNLEVNGPGPPGSGRAG